MTPERFIEKVLDPGLMRLMELGGPSVARNARRMLLAIALQESGPGLSNRFQIVSGSPGAGGPARGFYQFEEGGGVVGVLTHRASAELARRLCEDCTVLPHRAAVWRALEGHDVLATGFARLLLWTHPPALPETAAGWQQYMAVWRPGRPHEARWAGHWETATRATEQVA
jgi:hypothetical protein